ncbi:MAG: tetratricopeptide repeat protein [Candidatus Hermodarchaeota archaeon]
MSDSGASDLIRIKQLINQGKFKEALQIVEILEKKEDLPVNERLTGYLLKSTIMNKQGDYRKGLELAKQVYDEIKERESSLQQLDALITMIEALIRLGKREQGLRMIAEGEKRLKICAEEQPVELMQREAALMYYKGIIHWQKGDLDLALQNLQQNLALWKKSGEKKDIAASFNTIGVIYWSKGELDRALEYFEQSLVLRNELGNVQDIASCINNIGTIYANKGDLDRSLDYFEQALALIREIGNKEATARLFLNIGNIYGGKGELDQALEYYQQSLVLREEINNKEKIAQSVNNLGVLYRQKGKWDLALEHLERSLVLREEIDNKIYISETLFHLIAVAIDGSSFEQAQNYLQRLKWIDNHEKNKIISQRYRVAQALMLKTSTRAPKRAKAEELLKQIIEEEVVDHEVTVEALLNLCDLLLVELRITNESEVLSEINILMSRLLTIAKQQHSHLLITEIYILKSKLALLELDIREAQRFLDQAQLIVEEKGLKRLAIKVSREQATFREKIDKWKLIIKQNAPINERLELVELEAQIMQMAQRRLEVTEEDAMNYMKKAQQIIEGLKSDI